MYESSGYIKINTAYKSYIAALPKKALLYFIFFDIVIILMIIIFQRPGMIYIICASVSIFVCMLLLGGPYILLLKGYSSLQKQSNESVFKNGIPIHSVLNQEYCSHVLYKKNPEVSSYDDLSYYTYIDNICFLYGANKKIKKFYGCYFSIDKMSSNELEKMEQFLNSKNLRPRSLLF